MMGSMAVVKRLLRILRYIFKIASRCAGALARRLLATARSAVRGSRLSV